MGDAADEYYDSLERRAANAEPPDDTEEICPADGNVLSEDGVCGFCGCVPDAYGNAVLAKERGEC